MTISRVNPSGWAVNEELSSAQLNQLDVDHAKAVDKTGDSFTGELTTSGASAKITFATGSFLTVQAGATFTCSGIANFTGSTITVNAGSTFTVACALTASGGVVSTTGAFSGALSATTGTFSGAVSATTGTFSGNITGAANMALTGNLTLTLRAITKTIPYHFSRVDTTAWAYVGNSGLWETAAFVSYPATEEAEIDLDLPHGSRLQFFEVKLNIAGGHSNFPTNMPYVNLYRRTIGTTTRTALNSRQLDAAADFASTLANYDNQIITIANPVLINELIDRTVYSYHLVLGPETGSFAKFGAQYLGTKIFLTLTKYNEG